MTDANESAAYPPGVGELYDALSKAKRDRDNEEYDRIMIAGMYKYLIQAIRDGRVGCPTCKNRGADERCCECNHKSNYEPDFNVIAAQDTTLPATALDWVSSVWMSRNTHGFDHPCPLCNGSSTNPGNTAASLP